MRFKYSTVKGLRYSWLKVFKFVRYFTCELGLFNPFQGFDLGMKNVILSLLKELHHITIKETEGCYIFPETANTFLGFHDISTIEYHEKTRIMPSKELVKETLHLDKVPFG